jgi:hypothetical protein
MDVVAASCPVNCETRNRKNSQPVFYSCLWVWHLLWIAVQLILTTPYAKRGNLVFTPRNTINNCSVSAFHSD